MEQFLSEFADEFGLHVSTAYVRDGDLVPSFAGPGLRRLLGGDAAGPGARAWRSQVHPDDLARYDEAVARWCAGEGAEVVYRLIGLDGVARWIRDRGRPRHVGEAMVVDNLAMDITDTHEALAAVDRAREDAEERSRRDSLTGLWNRRHLVDLLDTGLTGDRRCGLVLVDLDHFKPVNDTHGHRAGDDVLSEVSGRIGQAVPPGHVAGRWGGEEFAVVALDIGGSDELRMVGERLRAAVGGAGFVVGAESIALTASVGVAASEPGDSTDDLFERADDALYRAKRQGRDCVRVAGDGRLGGEEPQSAAARALALAGVLHERFPQIHADQVSQLAAATARELGLTRAAEERIRLAGLLHDVGKIAIPESILNKPGPLDAAERALIDRHPELGAELVRHVPGLEGAVSGIRFHHERYDGDGYPDGLRGTRIPIDARIVAAVDTYSAITTDRPYQRATSHTMALAELRSCGGNQLDPVVVEALCRVVAREASNLRERLAG
jgi:diguanylate cyclase (GGDEF)-like protein/putative nucleotidyltransferase with HDIG domain